MIEATQRWAPGIGDPTFIGWFTAVAYFASAALSALCARREMASRSHRRFWWVLATVMLALGVNKQLDLQTLVTQIGRDLALSQGWYENRRTVQVVFIGAMVLVGVFMQWGLYRAVRRLGSEVRWAVIGLVFLTVFIIARATSFHHVDLLLHHEIGGWRINWILELSGIGCIAAAVARRLRVQSRPMQLGAS